MHLHDRLAEQGSVQTYDYWAMGTLASVRIHIRVQDERIIREEIPDMSNDELRDAAKKVLWKLERREAVYHNDPKTGYPGEDPVTRWARIDRNDATIRELRRVVEGAV